MRVDEVYEELEPRELTEWLAAYQIGLDEEGWLQAAKICETIQNESQRAINQRSGTKQVNHKHFLSLLDYLPKTLRPSDTNGKDR